MHNLYTTYMQKSQKKFHEKLFFPRVYCKNKLCFLNTNAPQGKYAGLPAKLNPVVQRGVKKIKKEKSIFFDNLNFHIRKIYMFYEVVLVKTYF